MSKNDTNGNDSDGVECPTCDRVLETERGMKIHHKQAHGESVAGVEVECSWCGDSYRKKKHWADRVDNHFCPGEDCEAKWKSEKRSGENGPGWKGGKVEVDCTYCGNTLKRKQYRLERSERQFCNTDCHYTWLDEEHDRSGENSERWQGGLVTVECSWCGDEKDIKPYRDENHERHFCHAKGCKAEWMAENLTGQENPRWNGGHSVYQGVKLALGDEPWEKTAERIRERDEVCRTCGGASTEQALDVHHIIPIRSGGDNIDELLMSFCRSCHMKAEAYIQQFPEFDPVLVE